MEMSPIAHTVSLHRVRLLSSSGCKNSSVGVLDLPADLEPIVIFTGRRGVTTTREKRGIVEESTPLHALLGWFCRSLLLRQRSSSPQQLPVGRQELFFTGQTSPVAAEGIFLQVPSPSFVSECDRAATSGGKPMDVVLYNSLDNRWWQGSDNIGGTAAGGGSCSCHGRWDEGYVYGFAHFIDVGHPTEGLLLAAFSASPLFNTLRTVVFATLSHVVRALRNLRVDWSTALQEEDIRAISAVCTDVMSPLADIVEAGNAACMRSASKNFVLEFSRERHLVFRPDDFRCPFIDVPLSTFFLSFSYNAIRVIHSLLLLEKRVVFIGATPQHASACVVSVQAMLVPFFWSLPIVPYLPPEAADVVDALGNTGFVLGSTADIVPRLMLRNSSNVSQTCMSTEGQKEENNRCRIWFADCRTGVIGVSPSCTDIFPFATLDLVPPSEKLKDAIKRIVTKEKRHFFRVSLASMIERVPGSFSSSLTLMPNMDEAVTAEVHSAFLEYNVHHILGNYRKGLVFSPYNTGCGTYNSSGNTFNTRVFGLQSRGGGTAYVLEWKRFLPGNLENNMAFALRIAETRMYSYWEEAVLALETFGLLRFLLGEYVCSRDQPRYQNSNLLLPRGNEILATHYYLSHPKMIGMLCLFYARSARRFPELYSDLQNSDFLRMSEGANLTSSHHGDCYAAFTPATSVTSCCGNTSGNSNSSNSGTSLMRSIFSKATKAVKNSLVQQHNNVFVQVFVQSYGSFSGETGYERDINKPARLNKMFKSNMTAATALAPAHSKVHAAALSPLGATMIFDFEDDFHRTCLDAVPGGTVDGDALHHLTTGIHDSKLSAVCQRLPLDVVHQFYRYHNLLDPTKEVTLSAKEGCRYVMQGSREELERFVHIAQLFAAEPAIWPVIELKRKALAKEMLSPPSLLSGQRPSLLADGSDNNVAHIPFEAQPLLFPKDLVTREVELPPVIPDPTRNQNLGQVTEAPTHIFAARNNQSGAVSCGSGNVISDLFDITEPQQQPTSSIENIDDFFV